MEALISVVVPVYNVEKYLKECLDSIVNQTYQNLQIILVDDGSTDSSGKICEEYAEKDKRITVVHQTNAGAGAAKNTGLELIKGAFFSLIDGDDLIDSDMYEKMLLSMERSGADIAQCSYVKYFANKREKMTFSFPGSRVLSKKQFLFELLYDWKYAVFSNKLFKTELLGDVRFPVGRKIDDEFFTYKLACNAKKICNIDEGLYYYRMRKSSVMNNNNNKRLMNDRCDCFEERFHYISTHCGQLKKYYYYCFADFLNQYADLIDSDKLERLKKMYPPKKLSVFGKLDYKIKFRKWAVDGDSKSGDYFE